MKQTPYQEKQHRKEQDHMVKQMTKSYKNNNGKIQYVLNENDQYVWTR